MTIKEFDAKMEKFEQELADNGYDYDYFEEWQEKVSEFQSRFMEDTLKKYKKEAKTEAQKYIAQILDIAIHDSESGNAIINVPTKKVANEIAKIIEDEIGEYLLDSPEIYEDDGEWAIDCMFAGNYVPYWDGWMDGHDNDYDDEEDDDYDDGYDDQEKKRKEKVWIFRVNNTTKQWEDELKIYKTEAVAKQALDKLAKSKKNYEEFSRYPYIVNWKDTDGDYHVAEIYCEEVLFTTL